MTHVVRGVGSSCLRHYDALHAKNDVTMCDSSLKNISREQKYNEERESCLKFLVLKRILKYFIFFHFYVLFVCCFIFEKKN